MMTVLQTDQFAGSLQGVPFTPELVAELTTEGRGTWAQVHTKVISGERAALLTTRVPIATSQYEVLADGTLDLWRYNWDSSG